MRPALVLALLLALSLPMDAPASETEGEPLQVVASLPDYAWAAALVGGDRVEVHAIASGSQDAHFIRPRPSYQALIRRADLLVTTGLDLELWLPTLLDAAGNEAVLEGAPGYVAAWPGIELLGAPAAADRADGDIHLYGNPHLHTDPLNMALIARNIAAGLKRIDASRAQEYDDRLAMLEERLHRRLFGDELVELLGGDSLARLARGGKLRPFLEAKEFPQGSGRTLLERLGGWLGRAQPLHGQEIIAYHGNWIYFARRFGLKIAGYVEPKPGIPPPPRHVQSIIELMQERDIRVVLSANYFDPSKPRAIARKTGATAVIVPLSTMGEDGVDTYEQLVDHWLDALLAAMAAGAD